jgi:FkbH-like protein
MYESEINLKTEPTSALPDRAVEFFEQSAAAVGMRTVLPWGEHCTECVWPSCYATCDLYEARADGKCRRFIDGMVRVDLPGSPNGYVLKIRFKRWGKLWTVGNVRLYTREEAKRVERWDQRIGTALQKLVLPAPAKAFFSTKRYSYKKHLAENKGPTEALPTAFLVECYNPQEEPIGLSLTVRSNNPNSKVPYQELLAAKPGANRFRIPYDAMEAVVGLRNPFQIELIPNSVADADGTTLYFGLLDFVHEQTVPPGGALDGSPVKPGTSLPKIKCVVWDLDNTLWTGILAEDGAERLVLKEGVRDIIQELDRRGILQSVASKNNHDEAIEVLKSMNLEEYFLFPQISWSPKSQAIPNIAQSLNIGVNTLLFVDDSEFEREEIRASSPALRVFDALEYKKLLDMPELNVPVTEESVHRRKMYRVENERRAIAQGFGEDYIAFLRNCRITITLRSMDEENMERVHELTQRTNQMNFSGNRYDRAKLAEILRNRFLDTYVIRCEDRFGSYGVVGFAIVDHREPRLTDLMFSCRIQSKRVEHAFLSYAIEKYAARGHGYFYADYRKTPRNAPSGQVFEDMGFKEKAVVDGVSQLVVERTSAAPADGIIQIVEDAKVGLRKET